MKSYDWILSVVLLALFVSNARAQETSIDATQQHAWAENIGWTVWRAAGVDSATVSSTYLSGYVWGENIGWINFDTASLGAGDSAYFDLCSRTFDGYAWVENVDWINLGSGLAAEALPMSSVPCSEELSPGSGGIQGFLLDAGLPFGGDVYWIFGSVTGTSPGLDFGGGVVLPLNFDAYFKLTLNHPGLGAFGNFLGTLDAQGQAAASLTFAAGVDPSLAGVTIHHAYLTASVLGFPEFSSNAVPLLLVP